MQKWFRLAMKGCPEKAIFGSIIHENGENRKNFVACLPGYPINLYLF